MVKETKKGKKNWIKIIAPGEFKDAELGESFVSSPEDLIGKTLFINLSVLLNDIRKQNINIGFKVIDVKNLQASTKVFSYELMPAHVRRMVRIMKERIDDSFIIESKDKLKIRIKPIILTKSKTKQSILNAIRKKTRDKLIKLASEKTFSDILKLVISVELQKTLKTELNKIYPLSTFEIRKLILLNR